jgi:hypothetical protein
MEIYVLLLLVWPISVSTRYSLYHSNIGQASYPTFDCLYAYLIDGGKETYGCYIRNSHLIPYCRRPDNDDEQDASIKPDKNIAEAIPFEELKKRSMTSEQLLTWFAPIDVAEKYEMNYIGPNVFYNCSPPWFGSMCQYKFDYDASLSFGAVVEAVFSDITSITHDIRSGTCYRFLTSCNYGLWPLCFDWREICDGKIDCMNGEDEQWCDQLEMTQCTDNEYRCHYGGQCIPLTFEKDSRLSIDCLDGSDEQDYLIHFTSLMNVACPHASTFQCQERIGRYPWTFQCGDGQYLTDSLMPSGPYYCWNNKDKELSRIILTSMDHIPNVNCRKAFYCALYFSQTDSVGKKIYHCSVSTMSTYGKILEGNRGIRYGVY